MINVTKTYIPNIDKYKSYIDQIFSSGWFTNNGSLIQELEARLAKHLGVKNLLLVSNGTLALQVCYKLLDLKGDVITTPFSFVATVSSMCWEGLNPVFVDIDPNTYNIDVEKIEQSITPQTKVIVAVHVFGNPCNVEEIEKIAKKHKLKVIYDGSHAFNIKYKNGSILNYGDLSTLSFHSTKVFHTIEGGAIIINDDDLYKKAKLMINFGIPGPDKVTCLGINAKMNEFQAAMGMCVLDDIDKIYKGRKRVYDLYMNYLSDISSVKYQSIFEYSSKNYAYFPILFDSEFNLLEIKQKLNENGINPRRYFYPSLDNLPYIKNNTSLPISNSVASRILCLPIYDDLSELDVIKICDIVKSKFQITCS